MKKEVCVGTLKKYGLDVDEAISDDLHVKRKSFDVISGKEIDGEQTFLAIMSNSSIDSDGEIVIPSGIDISQYNRNPVLLWQHDRKSPSIGKCSEVGIDANKGLMGKFVLASTQFARELWTLVKEKCINAVSIGFVPVESYVRGGLGFKEACMRFGIDPNAKGLNIITTRCILMETSLVTLPANRDALIIAAKSHKCEAIVEKLAIKEEKVTDQEVIIEEPKVEEIVQEPKIEEPKVEEPKDVGKITFTVIRAGGRKACGDDIQKAKAIAEGKII